MNWTRVNGQVTKSYVMSQTTLVGSQPTPVMPENLNNPSLLADLGV